MGSSATNPCISTGTGRNSGDIVPEELFVLQDISRIVKEKQASIPEELAEMRAMLRGKEPKIDIGLHCEDPYPCDFAELSKLRAALLEYCKQDTLGLVRLLEKMRVMEG